MNTAYGTRRLEYDLHLDEVDDLDAAKAKVLDALRETPSVLDDPSPDVLATDVTAKGATLRVRWWVRPPHRADIIGSRDEALAAIRRKLPQVSESETQPPA